ncbi:MAG: hypothetical protein ACO37W_11305 [Prochlorotrichaceae cyanobacterium]
MSDLSHQDSATQAIHHHNQQTYHHLKMAVGLNLRRQFFIAICDNLNLRNNLAMQLQTELMEISSGSDRSSPQQFISLLLDLTDPNPVGQIATWLQQHPQALQQGNLLGFQVLGIEGLTRQNPAIQRLFLSYLRTIERNLPRLNCSVVLWVTRPWANTLQQAAPECWNWSTGIFEFAGDPVPLLSNLFDPGLFPEPEPVAPEEPEPVNTPATPVTATTPPTAPPSPSHSPTSPPPQGLDMEQYLELEEILKQDLAALEQDQAVLLEEPEDMGFGVAWVTSSRTSHESASSGTAVEHHTEATITAAREPIVYPASSANATAEPQEDTLLEEDFFVEEDPLPSALDPMPPRSLSLAELEAQIELLRSQEAPLAQMAQAHLNLGRYYRQQIEQGDSQAETLLGAIAAYEQVLEWLCFSEVSPQEMGDVVWPDILNDLGTLYWLASRTPLEGSDAQGYLQQAVQAYQLGLKKIDEQQHPRSYAMLQNNLGTVFSDLAQWGEALSHLQKAVVAYQAALRYRRPDTDPLKFAATQNNLGTAYWHLAQHTDMTENLKQAINAYNQALRYYRPDREPNSYAMIQNNLGTAYWNLSQCNAVDTFGLSPAESHTQPDRRDWLLLAVNAYQSALRFRTIDTAAAAYAATQNNLGTAYWHLANLAGDQTATVRSYLKLSIEAYQSALKAADRVNTSDPTALSFDRYATHNNLGLILYQSAMLKDPKNETFQPSENQLASALHHHLQALKGWQAIPDLYQTALTAVVQTIRTCYEAWGTAGQNRALNQVPGSLLAEVLSKL